MSKSLRFGFVLLFLLSLSIGQFALASEEALTSEGLDTFASDVNKPRRHEGRRRQKGKPKIKSRPKIKPQRNLRYVDMNDDEGYIHYDEYSSEEQQMIDTGLLQAYYVDDAYYYYEHQYSGNDANLPEIMLERLVSIEYTTLEDCCKQYMNVCLDYIPDLYCHSLATDDCEYDCYSFSS
jgi:hypothetical protein